VRALAFALIACAAAAAQAQEGMKRIGILSPVSLTDTSAREQYNVFTDRLRELGRIEGKSVAIDWRFAEGRFERLPILAGELVKAKVDVIVTNGTPATAAARRATATIPIVSISMGDPVASGFAQSLARPGGNITGFSTMGGVVYEKRLELLMEAVPSAKRIGIVVHPDNNFFLSVLPALEAAAQKQGRDLMIINANSAKALEEGFGKLATARAGAVLIGDESFLNSQSGMVASLALKYRMPALFPTLRGVEDGGLIGYMNDSRYRYQSAAVYVERVLKGAKPAEMPIEQPTKFDLVVNKKTAATLGITVPPAILARASKIIE
jgi:putative ABC transport system substrate-binding protein